MPTLEAIARPSGGFAMVAMDQQESLRSMFDVAGGGRVDDADLIEWDLPDGPSRLIEDAPMPPAPAGQRYAEPDHDSSDAALPAERMAPGQRRRADG